MSGDSYIPLDLGTPPPRPAPASQGCSRAVAPAVAVDDGFRDWGKGADFRQFQRNPAKSVATVAAVAGPTASWADGITALHALPRPQFLPSERWDEIIFDAVRFVRDWGDRAQELGWSTLELFGCNPNPRAGRLDRDGVIILLRGRRVTALTDKSASIDVGNGKINSYYRGFELLGSVPLWVAFATESGP